MDFVRTQRAIDLRQRCSVEKWTEETYTSEDSDQMLVLEELFRLDELREPCDLHLVGNVKVRQWECNRTFASLDEALPGGLGAWILAAYHIEKRGLVVKYLPRREKRLMDEAYEADCQLSQLNDDDYFEPAAQKCAELYKKYATTLLLKGEFQAWFCCGGGHSDVVISHDDRVRMLTIRNERKHRNVLYYIGNTTQATQRIYA